MFYRNLPDVSLKDMRSYALSKNTVFLAVGKKKGIDVFLPSMGSFSGNMTQLKAIAMILLTYLIKHNDNAIYFVCVFYSSPTQTRCHSFCGSNYDPAFSGLNLPLNLNLSLTARQVSMTGQKAH